MRAAAAVLAAAAAASAQLPQPLALWRLQEATGQPRISEGVYSYALLDGDATRPVAGVAVPGGAPFGATAAYFAPRSVALNSSARLYAPRSSAPALTEGIAGPDATVTLAAWVRFNTSGGSAAAGEAMVCGVWDEAFSARQYALFTDLAVCSRAPQWAGGLGAHISPVGGPTPGYPFCETAACDPRPLNSGGWTCLVNSYNGTHITAYVNGTLAQNGAFNPYPLTGGIYQPANGAYGAEFGVGANQVTLNHTAGNPPVWHNLFTGFLGGLAVWNVSLDAAQVAAACELPPHFRLG